MTAAAVVLGSLLYVVLCVVAYVLGRTGGKPLTVLDLHRSVPKRGACFRLYDRNYKLLWAGEELPEVMTLERGGHRQVWKLEYDYADRTV